jgi:hypothetical protein
MGITREFFERFYGDAISADARAAVWYKDGKRHTWCKNIDEIEKAAEENEGKDTYFTVSLYPKSCTSRKQDKASALFGVWLDLDVGKPGSSKNYFPTMEEATAWIYDRLAGHWSIIVHSGGGIHLYLLFDEAFWIENADDRSKARRVAKAFQRYAAENCPYDIDMTFDLSRVMRLPGSTHTGTGEQCHVIDICDTAVSLSDLIETLPPVALGETSQMADDDVDVDVHDLKRRIALIQEVDGTFDSTWRRTRRFKDKSPSSYCMSIANQLVAAGLNDSEIMSALSLWRTTQTDATEKPRSWYRATVGKARASQDQNQQEIKFDQVVAEAMIADDTEKRDAVTMMFGIPFRRMIRHITPTHKGHEEKVSYTLEFKDGRTIKLDSSDALMKQHTIRVMMLEKMGVVMKRLKGPQFDAALAVLLSLTEDHELDPEGNTAFAVEQQLRTYVAMKMENQEVQENLTEVRPSEIYKVDEDLYFHWGNFKMRLENNRMYVGNKELGTILRALGAEPKQFSDKKRTRLWTVPEDCK